MAAVAPRCRWEIITSSGRGPGLLRTASDLWRARKRAQRGTHTQNYISQTFKDVQVWSFFTLKVTDQSAVNLLYFIHLIWGWLMLVVRTKSVSHITCSAFVLCREVLKHPKNNLCNIIWHTFLLILIKANRGYCVKVAGRMKSLPKTFWTAHCSTGQKDFRWFFPCAELWVSGNELLEI